MISRPILKTAIGILSFLTLTALYSYYCIPESFAKEGGGSCYQGITVTILHFFTEVCFVLGMLSVGAALKNWRTAAKITCILSLFFWLLWSVATSITHLEDGVLYFTPFLSRLSAQHF